MKKFVLLLLGFALQGPPPSGVIEGYVVQARTEQLSPLVNARLELNADQGLIARTESTGRFVFSGLPPGRYRLRVTKDGFIRQEYPRSARGAPGLPIDLAAGQQIRNVVFRLDPAPTISGVIRDANNAVVAGVVVQAMRRGYNARGNRIVTLIASAKTDDLGSYRLYWLDPGEYVIAAVPPPPASPSSGRAYGPTFYPGFAAMDDARPVRVDSFSREARGIDFRIVQFDPVAVRGNTVSVITGPVPADITLIPPEDSAGVAHYRTRSKLMEGDFLFSIPNVALGTYILSATTLTEAFATRILVRPSPVRNELWVTAELNAGVAIPGRVARASSATMDLRAARIHLAETALFLPAPAPAMVASDGSFLFKAVQPGIYALDLTDLPADLYLKSAVQGQIDILEKLLPVGWAPGGLQDPLDVQIGADGGRITGAVFDNENKPSGGAQITLIPEGEARSRPDRYRTAISGPDGSFTVRGIAPGDYRLYGWDDLEPNAYLNPDYMRAYQDLGTPVRIQPNQSGSSGSISIRLIQFDR